LEKISVIVPAYSWSDYLKDCLKSIFNSTYRNLEVLIIGGGDSPDTIETEEENKDKIRWFNQEDKGLAAVRNRGVRESTGAMIAFLDGKDITGRMRLELAVGRLLEKPSAGMVFCGMTFINPQGSFLKGVQLVPNYSPEKFQGMVFEKNLIGSISSTLIKKEVFENVGLFDESLSSCSEYDYWMRLGRNYQVEYLDLPLVRFRVGVEVPSFSLDIREKEEAESLKKHKPEEIALGLSRVYRNEEEFRLALGKVLYRRGTIKDALKNIERVLLLNEYNSEALFFMGNCFYYLGKYEKARFLYEKCLTSDPEHAGCRNNLGVILYLMGHRRGSIKEIKKASELREDYYDARFNLKILRLKAKKLDLRVTLNTVEDKPGFAL